MTIFVPVVLTVDQAKAASNACAAAFILMRGLAKPDHPVFTAALAIEDALVKAGAMEPLPRHQKENND